MSIQKTENPGVSERVDQFRFTLNVSISEPISDSEINDFVSDLQDILWYGIEKYNHIPEATIAAIADFDLEIEDAY